MPFRQSNGSRGGGDRIGDGEGLREADKLMAHVTIDPAKVRAFKDAAEFYKWLAKHHDKDGEVWIKIQKVGSGLEIDHAKGGHRCGALLGVDRRPAQGV